MKNSILSAAFATLLAFGSQPNCQATDDTPVKNLMQAKLRDAQSLVGSVVTGDFAEMEKSGKHLVQLGLLSSWLSSQSPDEQTSLDSFRRSAESLVKAAEKKNMDAASLAYVQLTLSCVDCHKFVREHRSAAAPQLNFGGFAGR